jgi:hypothetical protein
MAFFYDINNGIGSDGKQLVALHDTQVSQIHLEQEIQVGLAGYANLPAAVVHYKIAFDIPVRITDHKRVTQLKETTFEIYTGYLDGILTRPLVYRKGKLHDVEKMDRVPRPCAISTPDGSLCCGAVAVTQHASCAKPFMTFFGQVGNHAKYDTGNRLVPGDAPLTKFNIVSYNTSGAPLAGKYNWDVLVVVGTRSEVEQTFAVIQKKRASGADD